LVARQPAGRITVESDLLWKVYAFLGFAYWLPQLYAARRVRRDVPSVSDMPCDDERTSWPRISLIMTARDEERDIEEAVRSRLNDDYPELQVIVVDDRSSDRTGEIADRLASEDPRVETVHIVELPDGWVGKIYALHRGLEASTGDWFLFSDADVKVRPGILRRAISYAEGNGFDHLSVYPDFQKSNPLIDITLSANSRLGMVGAQVWKVSDPESSAAMGVGSFNLVRREAFEKTRGFEWLRLEIADDITLGQMLKASGAHQQFASGAGFLEVDFYPTISEALTGSERALFTAMGNFSLLRSSGLGLVLACLELSPFVLPLKRKNKRLRRLGLLLLAVELAVSLAFNDWLKRPASHAIVAPLGSTGMAAMIVRAGIIGRLRGGVYWRGTFYPTELLKPGRRFRP
jgi:glycosyltransferase involved in cell wall biosynthesis